MRSGAYNRFDAVAAVARDDIDDILAIELRSQISKHHRRGRIIHRRIAVDAVHGERLVVAQREEEGVRVGGQEEAGAVDRAAVVLHLRQGVVLVGDGCVVQVHEAVRAAGEEAAEAAGRVEAQLRHVVVVAFDVVAQRVVRGARVPV